MPYTNYLKSIQEKLQTGQASEHTYRGALEELLKAHLPEIARTQYNVVNEPKRIACGAPDFAIYKITDDDSIAIGYVEAKDIGINLDEAEKSEQLTRYKDALENLILTDYLEFRFFVEGKKLETIAIAENVNGKLKPLPTNFEKLQNLLKEFFANERIQIDSSENLAKIMANKTKLMKTVFRETLENSSEESVINAQYKAFEKMLINDLSQEQFTDIYAQTITYGLFTAKIQQYKTAMDAKFSRQDAAKFIPASNPFLRKLFYHISGSELQEDSLDETVLWVIDNLCDVFRFVDWQNILKAFDYKKDSDPIIHFYENFLTAYDAKLRKSRGVWYTPEPVVKFIVRAVDDCLKQYFNLPEGLANTSKVETPQGENLHKVQLLDVATGTGTFIAETIRKIHEDKFKTQQALWNGYVEQHLLPRLHGFEILMASYAICHLKIHLLLEQLGYKMDKDTPQRLGVYLTNALEEEHPVADLPFTRWLEVESNEASRIKRDMPVMVAFGNPPYNAVSQNMGDWITDKIDNYKYIDGVHFGERKHWLHDDYVKFIRLGEYYINKNGEGILAYITNHSYIDNPTSRGMRFHLLKTFDVIYIIDLHGNAKKQEKAPDGKADKNVFDIEQGVAIIIAVKNKNANENLAELHHLDLWGSDRQAKYEWLNKNSLDKIKFTKVNHQAPYYFFCPKDFSKSAEYDKGFKINKLFYENNVGTMTARDNLVVDFDKNSLYEKIKDFADLTQSDETIRARYFGHKKEGKYKKGDNGSWKLIEARKMISEYNHKDYIKPFTYRPLDNRYVYYTSKMVGRALKRIMKHMLIGDNIGLVATRINRQMSLNYFFISNKITDLHILDNTGDSTSLFPLYSYETDSFDFGKPTRSPNLDMDIVNQIADRLGLQFITDHNHKKTNDKKTFTPLDLLDYIYAALHSPKYRDTYKEFLKIDFPRVPYPQDASNFWALVEKGGQIRTLHLLENPVLNTPITKWEIEGTNIVEKPEYKDGRVYINPTQYFENVPMTAWQFYIGGYQPAQKWLKDRKGKMLDYEDLTHYQKIITALAETDRLMAEIDRIAVV